MAFNAKNLHYDKNEPAFLRKLRGDYGGLDGRHNVQIARPKKDRLKTGDDDEDDPLILDEQGERVDKADFERRMRGDDEVENQPGSEPGIDGKNRGEAEENHGDRQQVAEIGTAAASRKRKVGKVVGGEEAAEGEDPTPIPTTQEKEEDAARPKKKNPAAPKKKGKKIKLSFDDADG